MTGATHPAPLRRGNAELENTPASDDGRRPLCRMSRYQRKRRDRAEALDTFFRARSAESESPSLSMPRAGAARGAHPTISTRAPTAAATSSPTHSPVYCSSPGHPSWRTRKLGPCSPSEPTPAYATRQPSACSARPRTEFVRAEADDSPSQGTEFVVGWCAARAGPRRGSPDPGRLPHTRPKPSLIRAWRRPASASPFCNSRIERLGSRASSRTSCSSARRR